MGERIGGEGFCHYVRQPSVSAWFGNARRESVTVSTLRNTLDSINLIQRRNCWFLGNVTKKGTVAEHLRNEEREAIESALRLSHGRISGPKGAATRLGLPASTLEFRIKRLGIDKFAFR
jgi:transcriptional regulator with GAF, ATPase, and Fis domain